MALRSRPLLAATCRERPASRCSTPKVEGCRLRALAALSRPPVAGLARVCWPIRFLAVEPPLPQRPRRRRLLCSAQLWRPTLILAAPEVQPNRHSLQLPRLVQASLQLMGVMMPAAFESYRA